MSHGRSHTRQTLVSIARDDVHTVRYSLDGSQVANAWDRIGGGCGDYVRLGHSSGLSEEDIKDICCDARTDWYPLVMTLELPFELLQEELTRALDRHKKRVQRLPIAIDFESSMLNIDPVEKIHVVGLMKEIIVVLSPHMETALRRLRNRYHDLVVLAHGLEAFFELREPEKRSQYAEEASSHNRALYRALERFKILLEQSLVLALEESGSDRYALEMALRIVRADLVEDVLGGVDEI